MADADDHEKDVETSVGPSCTSFDSFVEVGAPQAGTADRRRRGRAEKERERGGGDGEASEVCGLLGLERISLIVLRHRGKYAGCLSRPESRRGCGKYRENPPGVNSEPGASVLHAARLAAAR